ncbi:nuclear transport factor 2 family protein [Nonomuraea candida]|uniref:nuclear transport factor 2 family protein n=1 Tax=Nonomuraea candida TaxID=359159 RepID=UPI000693E84C|nr:nuclear transport factor 2 family protein [Nonomuraea candida]
MSTITLDEVEALRARVRELGDRAELAALCDRYVTHLDRDRDDDTWFDAVFTEDVQLVFPMGEYKGMAGLARFQEMARGTFERTHHMSGNYAIEIDGDRARVRAHLTAVHVRRGAEPGGHFDIGGHYEAEAVRTTRGWRIRRFAFDLVWSAGEGPKGPGPQARRASAQGGAR